MTHPVDSARSLELSEWVIKKAIGKTESNKNIPKWQKKTRVSFDLQIKNVV